MSLTDCLWYLVRSLGNCLLEMISKQFRLHTETISHDSRWPTSVAREVPQMIQRFLSRVLSDGLLLPWQSLPHVLSIVRPGIVGLAAIIAGTCWLADGEDLASGLKAEVTPTAAISIKFDVPQAGRVSLAVYNSEGQMVRTLLTGQPMAAGSHQVHWDGLDRYGHPQPPGNYSWKLVSTQGLRAEFITQVGQNVDPSWERATGNHEAPVGAAIDATGLYRVGATNEGGHYAVKTDLEGKHLWATDRYSADPWAQGTVAATLAKDRLFELLPNGDVYGYDAATGRVFTGGNYDPKPWNFCWKGYSPPPEANDEEKRKLRAKHCPADLASDPAGEWILASYPQYQAVSWYSAKDGQLTATVESIEKLSGIAAGQDGTAYAISGDAVVLFGRDSKVPQVVISPENLQNPWRLAVDDRSGEILVAENSLKSPQARPHHQVKRFNSGGRLLRSYGQPEGRTDGVYDSTSFRGVTDIEFDHAGGFIITEGNHMPPRRTARFDQNGQLLREWIGCQHYGVLACPEPDNPRFVWTRANADLPGLLRWEVDYKNKSSRLVEVYQESFRPNRLLRNNSAHGSAVPTVIEHAGRLYIYHGAMGSLVLYQYDPVSKRIRPCNVSAGADGRSIIWNDLNDDGQLSDEEVHQTQRNIVGGYIDPADLSIRTTPYATRYQAGHVFKPARITTAGTPVYDSSQAVQENAWSENGEKFHPLDFRRAADGCLYGSISDATRNPHEGNETHGAWYYNSCSAIDRLVKWDAQGKPLWSVGRHSPDHDHETGSTAMPRGFVGLAHGCVVWADASDEEVARPTVWTEDGLYVDELLRIPSDNLPKEVFGMFNTNEYPAGHLIIDPSTMDTYYYAINSGGGSPIYRITGWEGWHRDNGQFELKFANNQFAKQDGQGLTAEYFNSPDCTGEPALTRVDQLVYFNWGKARPDAAIQSDIFSVRWSGQYEAATNEDLRFEVRGNFPWRDRGKPNLTRMWLNGKLVIDSTDERNEVRVRLKAGQKIDLTLECNFRHGEAAIALSHDTPGLDRRAVLPKFLHPRMTGTMEEIEVVSPKKPALMAHFDFEQHEGLLNWSRAGRDVFGRLTGIARRVPGRLGQGIELTANGEFAPASFPIDEELQLPDRDYAISFWFKTVDADVPLCEARRYSSYNNRWSDHLLLVERGHLQYRLRDAESITTSNRVDDGQWHHVVSTVGSEGHTLYLDGQEVGSGKMTRRSTSSNRLGLDLGPGTGKGTVAIDEVVVLGKVPDREEVTRIFARPR